MSNTFTSLIDPISGLGFQSPAELPLLPPRGHSSHRRIRDLLLNAGAPSFVQHPEGPKQLQLQTVLTLVESSGLVVRQTHVRTPALTPILWASA